MSRDTVSCRSCGATLGTLNRWRGGRGRKRPAHFSRVLKREPGVVTLLHLMPIRVELYCPACGNCGRTLGAEDVSAILMPADEAELAAC